MALVDIGVKCTLLHGNLQKFSYPLSTINDTEKVLGVIGSVKIHFVPEAVIDKMQAYPTPKNVKEEQFFVGT